MEVVLLRIVYVHVHEDENALGIVWYNVNVGGGRTSSYIKVCSGESHIGGGWRDARKRN